MSILNTGMGNKPVSELAHNSLVHHYYMMIKKYHRCFPVDVLTDLTEGKESRKAMLAEIERIEGVLTHLRDYLLELTKYVEFGLVYRIQDGYEVTERLGEDEIVRFEAEMARIRYILDR